MEFFDNVGRLRRVQRKAERYEERQRAVAEAKHQAFLDDLERLHAAGREFVAKATALGLAVPREGYWELNEGIVLRPDEDPPLRYMGGSLKPESFGEMARKDRYCGSNESIMKAALAKMANILGSRQ